MTPEDKSYYKRLIESIGIGFLIWPFIGILVYIPCMLISALLFDKEDE